MLVARLSKLCRAVGTAAVVVAALVLAARSGTAAEEGLALLHVGDQESWLLSAQGNLLDDPAQPVSFYGGVARLAALIAKERAAAAAQGRHVLTLNAGDAFLPGLRFTASFANLGNALPGGGQDFYDAIALRHIGFDAAVFGNHEFDLGPEVAARFVAAAGTTYLSVNLNFDSTPEFRALAAGGRVARSIVVQTRLGNRIGIVGATTPLLPRISSPRAVNLLNYDPARSEQENLLALVPLIQAEIDEVRAKGATVVVLVSHLQNFANERLLVPKLAGVDIVLSGGGHELMAGRGTPAVPGDITAIVPYPQVIATENGGQVLAVTSHFANKYLGVLNVSLDADGRIVRDRNGVPVLDTGTGVRRVSGRPGDPDAVAPDPVLQQSVVQPVRQYVEALNGQVIGHADTMLNGARGTGRTATTPYAAGVRNAETNLGNLVADALRFIGRTDVAFQNGGGIRASIAQGEVSVGDTFNVLPFTNLVVAIRNVTPEQLYKLMEHGLSLTTPDGRAEGRFPQISGMRIVYDSSRPAMLLDQEGRIVSGGKIVDLTLDDGTVIVRDGEVDRKARAVSIATIDFLANGGDGYPVRLLGLRPENLTETIVYQDALMRYLTASREEGGLGGRIEASRYAPADPFDRAGRLVDLAIARAEPGAGRPSPARKRPQ
jgi:5'-nucleotidase/UDP-sugar diphosphatase